MDNIDRFIHHVFLLTLHMKFTGVKSCMQNAEKTITEKTDGVFKMSIL